MKKRRCWRYKCDHCRKSGCSGGAMKAHEERCFFNPNRRCVVCQLQWPYDGLKEPIADMANIDESNEATKIKAISDAVDQCPACICAAIHQAPLPMVQRDAGGYRDLDGVWHDHATPEPYRYHVNWDYKAARDLYREEMRAEERSHYSF